MSSLLYFVNFDINGKQNWKLLRQDQFAKQSKTIYFKTVLGLDRDPDEASVESIDEINYYGPFYLDFDGANISEVIDDVNLAIEKLTSGWDIPEEFVNVWLSGKKGFHITIDPIVFGLTQKCKQLPYIYGLVAKELGDLESLDMAVYSGGKGRMWRCPNIKRSNGMYKVPVTIAEVKNMDEETYLELIKEPREIKGTDMQKSKVEKASSVFRLCKKRLTDLRKKHEKEDSNFQTSDISESPIPGCIKILVKDGDSKKSNFNKASMVLASYIAAKYKPSEKEEYTNTLVLPFCEDNSSSTYDTKSSRIDHVERLIKRAYDGGLKFKPHFVKSVISSKCGNCPICSKTASFKKEEEDIQVGKSEEINLEKISRIRVMNGRTYLTGEDSNRLILTGALTPTVEIFTSELDDNSCVSNLEPDSVEFDAVNMLGDKAKISIPTDTWSSTRDFTKIMNKHNITNKPSDTELQELRMWTLAYSKKHSVKKRVLTTTNGILFERLDEENKKAHFVEADASWSSDGESHFRLDTSQSSRVTTQMSKVNAIKENDEKLSEALTALFNMNKTTHIATMVGWVSACHYKQHIMAFKKSFPILALSGAPGSGKTMQAKLIANLGGLSSEDGGDISVESSTLSPLRTLLKSSTTIPRLVDEVNFGNMKSDVALEVNGLLKCAWNNTPSARGVLKAGKVTATFDRITAPLIIMSEEPIDEGALKTRSLKVQLSYADNLPKRMRDSYLVAERTQHHLLRMAKALINDALATSIKDVTDEYNMIAALIPDNLFTSRAKQCRVTALLGLRMLSNVMQKHNLPNYKEVDSMYDTLLDSYLSAVNVAKEVNMTIADTIIIALDYLAAGKDKNIKLKAGEDYFYDDQYLYLDLQKTYLPMRQFATRVDTKITKYSLSQIEVMLSETGYSRDTVKHPKDPRINLLRFDLNEFYRSKKCVLTGFSPYALD